VALFTLGQKEKKSQREKNIEEALGVAFSSTRPPFFHIIEGKAVRYAG
jgi:hypothetical protein